MSDYAEEREKFKALVNRALELLDEAKKQGSPEDAKLGMQGAAAWSYAYRIIFEELKPQIDDTKVWVYYRTTGGKSFVDDVIEYTNLLRDELDKFERYYDYYGH